MEYGIVLEKEGKVVLRENFNSDKALDAWAVFDNPGFYREATGEDFPDSIKSLYTDGHIISSRHIGPNDAEMSRTSSVRRWALRLSQTNTYERKETSVGEEASAKVLPDNIKEYVKYLFDMEISFYPESESMSELQFPGKSKPSESGTDFTIYPKGFVINLDKLNHSALFTTPAHFVKFTKKNMKSGAISAAKPRTIKELRDILKKYRSEFSYMSRNYGHTFGIAPSCRLFIDDYVHWLLHTAKDRTVQNEIKYWEEVLNILRDINAYASQDSNAPTYGKTSLEEAILRMKSLRITGNTIRKFRQGGTIMMSENGGFLYNLSDEGKTALSAAKEYGVMPYHVIKSGYLYIILYVGKDREEWEHEKYSPKNNGELLAYVYNSDLPILSEFEYVSVAPSSGGVVLTA